MALWKETSETRLWETWSQIGGKPGVESLGNLSEWGMSGDKRGTRRLTGAACCEGTWVPADKVSGIGTVRVS